MLAIVPIHFKEACEFILAKHRHHRPPQGHKFSLAVTFDGLLVGVAVVGRPIARYLDDGKTLEVTRLCTDGTANACSKLYAASWRVGREMGYQKMITYILQTEPGTSLLASGWICEGVAGGGNWNKPGRPRLDSDHQKLKKRFAICSQIGMVKDSSEQA